MDGSNDGFTNSNLFADSQQFHHAYDNLFSTGADQSLNDASWGVNASEFQNPSRAPPQQQQSVPTWQQQNPNHLSATPTHAPYHGQPTAYARSLSHSPAPFAQNAFSGYANSQSFNYAQPQYDPGLFGAPPSNRILSPSYPAYANQAHGAGTIAPQALEQDDRPVAASGNSYSSSGYVSNSIAQARNTQSSAPAYVDQRALIATIPQSSDNGYHSIIDFDQLVRATNSERMGPYLNIGKEARDFPMNRTTTLPQYVPRKSRNELRKLAGGDMTLLKKIGKKPIKQKIATTAPAVLKSFAAVRVGGSPTGIKYEGESSSSEEESEDDDDSSYASDDDLEGAPLPNKRPDNPKSAVEYDTIKALWRSKRKAIDSAEIRKALTDFWEVVKTIRDRWKSDATAVADEEKKNKPSDLPLLKSRVKDQRDMMESAFKAALKHGHRDVLELLAENSAFVFLCYQFLLDRAKEEDFNGPMSRAILETMSLFTTLTEDLTKRTHLDNVLPRYVKKGDAKTQFYAKRIVANAAAASKSKAVGPQTTKTVNAEPSKPGNVTSPPAKRVTQETVVHAGVKRSAGNAEDNGPQKKAATTASKLNGVANSSKIIVGKKPVANGEITKPSAPTPATKTKVTAKPSSFFSTLSAAKKPGTSIKGVIPSPNSATKPIEKKPVAVAANAAPTVPKSTFSFAETMANLAKPKEEKATIIMPQKEGPPESLEEKAKRLRKEARRKLHVSFKTGDELEQIRYFTHDPEEERRHDYSQTRDVADVGGEGRMLKMHMMDVDDEDETAEEEQNMIEYREPARIDFSDVDPEERKRNYAPYGGGHLEPVSAERVAREQYEANTLLVFYSDQKDIPPNPREPNDPFNGDDLGKTVLFGPPDQKLLARAQQKRAVAAPYRQPAPAQPSVMPNIDLSTLSAFMGHQAQAQAPAPAPAPAYAPAAQPFPAVVNTDIQKILQSLQQNVAPQAQQQPQAAPMISFGMSAPASAPAVNVMQQQQVNGQQQPDLAAILAQIQGGQQFGAAPSAAPMLGGFGQAPPMQQQDTSADSRERYRNQGEKGRPYKTKICKYWQEGRCVKGDACTYLHHET